MSSISEGFVLRKVTSFAATMGLSLATIAAGPPTTPAGPTTTWPPPLLHRTGVARGVGPAYWGGHGNLQAGPTPLSPLRGYS